MTPCAQLHSVSRQSQVKDQGRQKKKASWKAASPQHLQRADLVFGSSEHALLLILCYVHSPSHVPLVLVESQGISSFAKYNHETLGRRLNDPILAQSCLLPIQELAWSATGMKHWAGFSEAKSARFIDNPDDVVSKLSLVVKCVTCHCIYFVLNVQF